jgi:transposase
MNLAKLHLHWQVNIKVKVIVHTAWLAPIVMTVFYELSSTTFYGSKCLLMKWRHCKEGYENHIVLAIVVNKEGLPFYWEVLPGGTADSKTIVWLMERLQQRFKTAGATVVFDRGMVSDDNLALIEEAKIKYISAMDKNQIEKITGIDFNQFSGLDFKHIANCEQYLALDFDFLVFSTLKCFVNGN